MSVSPRTRVLSAYLVSLSVVLSLLVPWGPAPAAALEAVSTADPLGDFEAPGTVPQGWSVAAPDGNQVAAIGSRAVSGARSLLVRDVSSTAPAVATRRKLTAFQWRTYVAQGYVFSTRGSQILSLDFFDSSGARIARHQVRTPPAEGVWTRVEVRGVAPTGTRAATLQIASTSAGVSEAWWDSVVVIDSTVPNSSFEELGTGTGDVPGWYTPGGPGAGVSQTDAYARTGRRAALVEDRSTSSAALLQTARVAVLPGVAHDARFWIRPIEGTFLLSVKWFTAGNSYISADRLSLSYPPGDWRLVHRTVMAPPDAAKAIIQIATRSSTTSVAAFDTVSLMPHVNQLEPAYRTESVGEPLTFSNTNAVESTVIDGRAKLYTVVSGYPAAFQVLDLESDTVEVEIPFPDPNISQTPAMTTGADGRVYIGTLGGRLWRWTPGTSGLEELGQVTPGSTAVWDLETAPDGRIWGGTSPDGMLFVFDPASDTVTERARVSTDHTYVRSVAVDADFVYVGASPTRPTFFRMPVHDLSQRVEIAPPVSMQSGTFSEVEIHDRFLAVVVPGGTTTDGQAFAGSRYLYDTETGSFDVEANVAGQRPSESDASGAFYYIASNLLYRVDGVTGEKTALVRTTMPAGRDRTVIRAAINGVEGEWLIAYDVLRGATAINLATFEEQAFPATFLPTASRMKSMAPGPDGKLYVGGYGGASLAVVDPLTADRVQYPLTPTAKNVIGEVEGMIANGQYMFLGTYTGGKIFRYDTTQAWVDGTNPALVADLSVEGQDRPQAWATAGSRTYFGTIPKYGLLGGDLGIIDTLTGAPRIIEEPVTDQSVVSLAARTNVVYGGTSRWGGMGITPTTPTAKLFAFDVVENRMLWEVAPAAGVQSYGALAITPEGDLWAAAGPVLYLIDRRNGAVLRRVTIDDRAQPDELEWRNVDLEYVDGLLYLSAGADIYTFDPQTLRVTKPAWTTTSHRLLGVVGDDVYYPNGTELMRLTPP